jgi:multiple sugar transport system permease protein
MKYGARLANRGYTKAVGGMLIVLAYMFPFYWMMVTSLKSRGDIFATPPILLPIPPIFTYYIEAVFDNPAMIRAVANSVIISVSTTALTLLLAVPAAYALARLRLRFTGLIVLLLLIAQLLPAINLALPLFVIFSRVGLVNSYQALILADTMFTLPFAIIILRPFFLAIPKELEDAAQVDGCTVFGAFWRVVLPLVRPGLITVGALAFVMTWGEFIFGLTLTSRENLQPVTVFLNRFIGQYGTDWGPLMAVSTAIALPIIVIFAGLQRFSLSGLTTGAINE